MLRLGVLSPLSIGRHYQYRPQLRSVLDSGVFNADWYATTYPDYRIGSDSPEEHYVRYGVWENRDPSPLFSCRFYKRQLGREGIPAMLHYIKHGWRLGLMPNALFDMVWYCNENRDNLSQSQEPLAHYLKYELEGRVWPNPLFDPVWVRKQYASEMIDGVGTLESYLTGGRFNIWTPNPLFDPEWYAGRHPDAQGQIPLAHYLAVGIVSGLSPHPWVDGDRVALLSS